MTLVKAKSASRVWFEMRYDSAMKNWASGAKKSFGYLSSTAWKLARASMYSFFWKKEDPMRKSADTRRGLSG